MICAKQAMTAGVAGMLLSGSAMATLQVTFNGVASAWGSSTNGGPFAFTANAALAGQIQGIGLQHAGAGRFISFCIERNEYLSNTPASSTFDVTIGTAAVEGGVGGPSPDPLGFATAYLYQNFMYGTLTTTVTYSAGTETTLTRRTGNAMQAAIWFLEEEITSTSSLGLDSATVTLANSLIAEALGAGWTNWGNVRVLNLFDPNGGEPRQSQLVLIPLPGATHLSLAGLAFVGLGVIRRRGRPRWRQTAC
jgi:hypothetical protein